MKAIVIGLGLIGSDYGEQSHAGVYAASDRIELVAGIDTDAERRRRFGERWKVGTYFGIGPWPDIDVVSICTPSDVRVPVIQQALELRPKAIWCEKPLAETVAEGEEIVKLCRDAKVALQVNFQRRFDPLHQQVRAIDFGAPIHFNCRFSGNWLRVGCHAVDLLRWFIGEPDSISRVASTAILTAGDSTGTLTQVEGNGTTIFDVDVTGPKEHVSLTAMGQQAFFAPSAPSPVFAGVTEQRVNWTQSKGLRWATTCGLGALLDHIENGTPLLCTGEDGLAALRIHEAIA